MKTNKIRKHIQLNLSWYTSIKGNNYTDVSDHIANTEPGSIHLWKADFVNSSHAPSRLTGVLLVSPTKNPVFWITGFESMEKDRF